MATVTEEDKKYEILQKIGMCLHAIITIIVQS